MSSKDKGIISSAVIAVAGLVIFFMTLSAGTSIADYDNNVSEHKFVTPHQTYLPSMPDSISFCGERVPLERRDIYEALDREMVVNTFAHTNTILILKRMTRYFPLIESVLKEEGVPDDFKYLAVAESNLYDIARSPVDAIGLWQFLKTTGKEYGLEVNDEIDERYHIEKSTRAACRYFRKAYEEFGSWTMVAASYNGGMRGVKNMKNLQHQSNYYEMIWVEETARYVFRIIAFKQILSNPESYGFNITESDRYQPWRVNVVDMDTTIVDLAQWAIDRGTTYKRVKELNRWIRQNKINNPRRKTYHIAIPKI
ncbi:MAG: lytic transglycosylase domain-containing protein [Bacteroidales bacterium]|nr:lytic transglycosylase domain-containing protein [Bacteroidales bacterium]